MQFCLVLPIEIVLSVFVAYLFFLAFERPFLLQRAPSPRPAAAVPAPLQAAPVAQTSQGEFSRNANDI